uniref:hypothetical protein n=1 Tax=Flavobacterium sp. TaxID=239 RepID=UPI00374D9CD5
EIAENKENTNLNQVKNDLELDKFSNVNIAENVAIDWETIKETQKGNFKISEISAHEKTASMLESNVLENHLKYQVVTIESEGQLHSYFVEIYTNKGSNVYPETITKLNDFTGTLNVFLLNGENLGSIAIYNGKARNISENNNLNILEDSINIFLTKSDAANKMPQCGGNYTAIIDQTTSRFDIWSVGNEIILIKYLGTTTTRTTSIMPFPCDGNYSKEDIINQRLELYNYKSGSGVGVPTAEQIAKALQKQIDATKLDPCPKAVLEQLKNATNFDIAAMLIKLGADKIYTLTFVSEVTSDSKPAATQHISPFNYKIQISTDYTGATKLFRAGNMLHEIGHAYFMSLKDDYSNSNPPNPAVFNNYPVLFQGYVEKKFPNNYDAHHIEMANQYIDVIAQTLQEYNKGGDPNNIIPYQVYTDLAWGGLIGTPVFEEKFPSGSLERLRIENRYACEQSGNAVGYSTGELQNTVGKPCN